MNLFPEYGQFLRMFLDKGYQIKPLATGPIEPAGVIYLRHDIDFDCALALKAAEIEADLGISSTYFFLLTSDSYNPFSAFNAECINKIRALGHKISVHFDPLRYDDFRYGLKTEVSVFSSFFNEEVNLVSLHRPNDFFLSFDEEIEGVEHTYQKKYFNDIKYIADSRGEFRFGKPEESQEFQQGKSIHLLTHPIWWTATGNTPQDVMDICIQMRLERFQEHIERNCLVYKKSRSSVRKED